MKPQANYMPPEQFALVLSAIPRLKIRKWSIEQVTMLFKICYWCGLRINEAIRLKVEDFDLERRRVYLGITKTTKGDKATIPERFLDEISLYLLGKQGELFPELNRFIVHNWIKRLGKMLQIEAWITPQSITGEKTMTHIFRKSVGKDMLYGTVDGVKQPLNVVQKKLRHTNLDMTSNYLKVSDEDVSEAGW